MRIISTARIIEFYTKHADSKTALEYWANEIEQIQINNLNDLRQYFNKVSILGNNRVVFDIKGNKYRIITVVKIELDAVFIRFIGTHAEYDKVNAHTI